MPKSNRSSQKLEELQDHNDPRVQKAFELLFERHFPEESNERESTGEWSNGFLDG